MKSEPSKHERREKMWITRKHRCATPSPPWIQLNLNFCKSELFPSFYTRTQLHPWILLLSLILTTFPTLPAMILLQTPHMCCAGRIGFRFLCSTFEGGCRLRMPLGGSSGGMSSAGVPWWGRDVGSGSHIHTHNIYVSKWVMFYTLYFSWFVVCWASSLRRKLKE